MARERRVNLLELTRWVRSIAFSVGCDPQKFTIADAKDVARVNNNLICFEEFAGIK